jgi:ribosomal-protein-alanine N-acetyltransferase
MSPDEPARLRFVRLEERHLPEVMAIEREAYPEPWTENMFRQEVHSAASYFYVTFHEDVLVGYVGFWLAVDDAHITSVTGRDTYRRRGFGRMELRFILGVAARLGLSRATLEVRASNLRAQNLYLTMGFRQMSRRRGYYSRTNEDAIVMVKDLDAEAYLNEPARLTECEPGSLTNM